MDIVLRITDRHVFTPFVYPDNWPEDDPWRQMTSLLIIVNVTALGLYFLMATASYVFIFDHRLLKHPLILKNQVRKEIAVSTMSIPLMSIPTAAVFLTEVRGYSKFYDTVEHSVAGYLGVVLSMFTFIAFTDACIYWIHRGLHHKLVYRRLHKLHHKWKVPTPFASHACHPVDGFIQSLPYHLYPFLFPMHKLTYLFMFVLGNVWTVSIHDNDSWVPEVLRPLINGSAYHTEHHAHFNYNYGQYTTLWDRIGGSFRTPATFEGNGPLDQCLNREKKREAVGRKYERSEKSEDEYVNRDIIQQREIHLDKNRCEIFRMGSEKHLHEDKLNENNSDDRIDKGKIEPDLLKTVEEIRCNKNRENELRKMGLKFRECKSKDKYLGINEYNLGSKEYVKNGIKFRGNQMERRKEETNSNNLFCDNRYNIVQPKCGEKTLSDMYSLLLSKSVEIMLARQCIMCENTGRTVI